jgi:hypothetical protein
MFDANVNGIEIFVAVLTGLYYFVYNNPRNRGSVIRLMNQNNYDPNIYRTADFLREISNFEHIDVEMAQTFAKNVID